MDFLKLQFLAIIQGLTEFLPVSSSGHLALFKSIFGLKEPGAAGPVSISYDADPNVTVADLT